jgi:hypothetical protein
VPELWGVTNIKVFPAWLDGTQWLDGHLRSTLALAHTMMEERSHQQSHSSEEDMAMGLSDMAAVLTGVQILYSLQGH